MAGGNLNLDGFITPTDNFAGLYKLGDTLQRKNYLDSAKADRAQRESDRLKAQQNAQSEFFTNELNKKNNLTGSLYDNNISGLLGNALQQAQKLSSQGAQTSDIQMAIQPLLDQVNTYQSKAKMYDANKKAWLESMKGVNGYDLNKVSKLADQSAFYETDPKTGQPVLNPDKADPSFDYYTKVIQDHPELVTNSNGISDLVNKFKPDISTSIVKRTNEKGGYVYRKTKVSANPYMVVDNGDVVPQYEIAKDGDKVLTDDKGQPIKVLPQDVFNSMLSSKEGTATADWLKGQLRLLGDSTDFKNANSNLTARHILWQQLKDKTPVHMEDVDNQKDNPIYRPSISIINAQNAPVIDTYTPLKQAVSEHLNTSIYKPLTSQVDNHKIVGGVPFNSLDDEQQTVVTERLKNAYGQKFNGSQVYLAGLDKNGNAAKSPDDVSRIGVYNTADDNILTTITKTGSALTANQSLGENSKKKAVEQAKNQTNKGMSDADYANFLKKNKLK